MSKKAIVLGASGLVGSALVRQLIVSNEYDTIAILVRRKLNIDSPKVQQIIIDFDRPESYKNQLNGDVLFSAFGTTIKKAGSQANQYKIDFTYQYQIAKTAAVAGVKNYVLVSSAGANSKSMAFYTRIKGELDEAVQLLSFETIRILRPSILDGVRIEKRVAEQLFLKLSNLILPQIPFLKQYRPISVEIVAKAMQKSITLSNKRCMIAELETVFDWAK